jgi:ATP citrate (pro-S)-lyase
LLLLLSQGDRFGGALDGAAQQFSHAFDIGQSPREFVLDMRKQNTLIMGIGHRVKSTTNPDMRVTLIRDFVLENFPNAPLLKYTKNAKKEKSMKRKWVKNRKKKEEEKKGKKGKINFDSFR